MLSTDRRRACGKERGSWKIRWISNKKCTSCSYVYTILVKVYAPQSRVVSISRKHESRQNSVACIADPSKETPPNKLGRKWKQNNSGRPDESSSAFFFVLLLPVSFNICSHFEFIRIFVVFKKYFRLFFSSSLVCVGNMYVGEQRVLHLHRVVTVHG